MDYSTLACEDLGRSLVGNGKAGRSAKERRRSRAVETGLLMSLIAAIALVAVKGVGIGLSLLFTTVSSSL